MIPLVTSTNNYLVNQYFCYYAYYLTRHETTTSILNISPLTTSSRRISSSKTFVSVKSITNAKCELDSHADTTVADANRIILSYNGIEYDVTSYCDDYEPIKNISLVTAATVWQSKSTGETFILVFNEELWMGNSMQLSLINPNQSRYYGVQVQDNPMSNLPLSIVTEDNDFSMDLTEDNDFSMDLTMAGSIVYPETHTPTD